MSLSQGEEVSSRGNQIVELIGGTDGTPIGNTGNAMNVTGTVLTAPVASIYDTYSAAAVGLVPGLLATDIFTISGSATKTVKITRIEISATQTTLSAANLILVSRSTANTGGTSTTVAGVEHSSPGGSSTAVVRAYTANPAALGTSLGPIRAARAIIPALTGNLAPNLVTWTFGDRPSEAITLTGTGELLAVNLNGLTVAGGVFDISVEWTET